jgi:propanol-preferring alcohol dehydrogenase
MIVALSESRIDFNPYRDLLAKERRIIGCSDHTRDELLELVRFVLLGRLDMSRAISATVPLDAAAINAVLDDLDRGTPRVRTVITPQAT